MLPGPRVVVGAGVNAGVAPAPHSHAPQEVVLPEVMAQAARSVRGDEVTQIELDRIDANPYQTRHFSDRESESEDFVASTLHELAESIKAKIPLGRFAEPEEVAKAAVFLAADGDYITGQELNVNGGVYM